MARLALRSLALSLAVLTACVDPVVTPDAGPVDDAGTIAPDAGDAGTTACNAPTDCPGEDEPCRVRTCDQGSCGFLVEDDGTVLEVQQAGDCATVVCDGEGGIRRAIDDGDLPSDEGACRVGRCTDGEPSIVDAPNGNDCGEAGNFCSSGACVECDDTSDCANENLCESVTCVENACQRTPREAASECPEGVCDGAGACVACVDESQCATPESPCRVAQCLGNACVPAPLEEGTPVVDQGGNCFRSECDASGDPRAVVDVTDPFVDGNACTSDRCTLDGTPVNAPLAERDSCGDGLLCRADAACVACLVDTDCPEGESLCSTRACVEGACRFNHIAEGQPPRGPAQPTGDCHRLECDGRGVLRDLVDNTDLPVATSDCVTPTCTEGAPTSPAKPARVSCTGGLCDGAGACVACLLATDCPGTDGECRPRTCVANVCGFENRPEGFTLASQVNDDCRIRRCNATGGVSVLADPTDPIVDNNVCTTDTCIGTATSNPPVPERSPCTLATGSGLCNAAGTCVACILNTDCASGGRCEGGVCAAPTCTDTIRNAGETGVDCGGGTCPTCGTGGGCTDAVDCQSFVCGGDFTCAAPSCTDGVKNGDEDGVDCGGACALACRRVMAVAAGASGAIAASWVPGNAWTVTLVNTRSTSRPGLAFKSSKEAMALFRYTQLGQPDDQGIFQLPWNQATRFGPLTRVPNVATRGSTPIVATSTGYVSVHHGGSTGDFDYYDLPFTQAAPGNATALGIPGSTDPAIAQSGTETGLLLLREFNNRVAFASRTNGTWGALQDNVATDPLIPGPVANRIPPALAAFGTGDFVGVYLANANNRLRFIRRTAGVWSAPADVPDAFTADRPVLQTLGTTGVGLGFRGLDQNLYYTRYSGSTWSAPEQVTTNVIGVPGLAPGFGLASVEVLFIGSTGELFHTRRLGSIWITPILVGGANLLGVAAASVAP